MNILNTSNIDIDWSYESKLKKRLQEEDIFYSVEFWTNSDSYYVYFECHPKKEQLQTLVDILFGFEMITKENSIALLESKPDCFNFGGVI